MQVSVQVPNRHPETNLLSVKLLEIKCRKCRIFLALPTAAEEVLHQLAAVGGEDAADDGGLGVQGAGGILSVAALGVVAAVDDAGHLCPAQGSGAHGARLDGDVEGAVGQVFYNERLQLQT